MTGAITTALHFAAHLLALTVAVGAAIVVVVDRDERRLTRIAVFFGFLSLAAADAVHGAGYAGELGGSTAWLRTAGYALVGAFGLVGKLAPSALGVVAMPGRAVAPAIAAGVAAVVTAIRRRDRPHLVLAGGLAVLAVSELLLAANVSWWFGGYHIARTVGFLGFGWFALLTTRRSIQVRIVAGFVAVLLAVVLGVSSAVTQIIGRNLRSQALDRVGAQVMATKGQLGPLITGKTVALLSIAGTPDIVQRIQRGQRFEASEVKQIRELFVTDVDFVLILRRGGLVLGKTGVNEATAFEIVGTKVVRAVLRSGAETSSVDTIGVRPDLALIGAAPIEVRGRPIGAVVAGFRIDDVFLLSPSIRPPEGSRAAVFARTDPVPVATANFPERPGPLLDAGVLQSIADRLRFGTPTLQREMSIGGSEHFAAFAALQREDNTPAGILLVTEPATIVGQTQRDVNRVIFLVTIAVVALALLLSLVAARRIAGPIQALTRAARRVQAGDLEAKAPVTGPDEVGNLSVAFNQMTESIQTMTDDLRAAAMEQTMLRSRLETVVNSMNDGLVAVDDSGRVVIYNPAAGRIVGRPRSSAMGKRIEDVIRLMDSDGVAVKLAGEAPTGTAFVRGRDDRDVPVAISSGQLRDGSGSVLGYVYVLRDISREHEVERMKTEFLSNVSHELRTPLTPIIGYSELLQHKQVPTAKATDFAEGILRSARRLERIVAMLVDFSAMEGGRLAVTTEPVALRPLVTGAVSEWKEKASRHKVSSSFDSDLPDVLVDVSLIRRTLDELLDNAVKYSPKGGRIKVAVSSQNTRRQTLVKVDVSDEGIGIQPEDLPDIFEDFRQVDASDTRTFGGLGLGLAFVKRIVEAHGGTIDVASKPGEGTTFSFTLRAADKEDGKAAR